MTEIAEKILLPQPRAPRYNIDPVAFAVALIASPVLVAVLGFPALFIPVFALVFGGPIYLVVGTPLLLLYLQRHPCTPNRIAKLALVAMVAVLLVLPLGLAPFADLPEILMIFKLAAFGLIFAPLWGHVFGWIYRGLCRDLYARAYAL